jgi:RNA polymerase-binding transcription factor DksA
MDTEYFKEKLKEDLEIVESDLAEIAVLNTETGEWEAKADDMETMSPTQDSNEYADQLEELNDNKEELAPLQERWDELKAALEKIANGTYGKCEVGGEAIEEARLEANPAARTCKKHM